MNDLQRPSSTTVVHLLRHGEVANPESIIYGRISGYHLSEDGRLMAKAAAAYLAPRDITVLRTSPLERAVETAEPLAALTGLTPEVDERLIEPRNHFEGERFSVGEGSLLRPGHWFYLRNPFRPSWGEPYRELLARMRAAVLAAAAEAAGHEAICVSHQLPIWVLRRSAEHRPLWHDPRRRQCALGSVTSFTFRSGRLVGLSYFEPSDPVGPQVAGA